MYICIGKQQRQQKSLVCVCVCICICICIRVSRIKWKFNSLARNWIESWNFRWSCWRLIWATRCYHPKIKLNQNLRYEQHNKSNDNDNRGESQLTNEFKQLNWPFGATNKNGLLPMLWSNGHTTIVPFHFDSRANLSCLIRQFCFLLHSTQTKAQPFNFLFFFSPTWANQTSAVFKPPFNVYHSRNLTHTHNNRQLDPLFWLRLKW